MPTSRKKSLTQIIGSRDPAPTSAPQEPAPVASVPAQGPTNEGEKAQQSTQAAQTTPGPTSEPDETAGTSTTPEQPEEHSSDPADAVAAPFSKSAQTTESSHAAEAQQGAANAAPAPAPPRQRGTARKRPPVEEPADEPVFHVKQAQLRPDQLDDLSVVARRLERGRPRAHERRITENTLIRVAVDVLLSVGEDLAGITEREILESLQQHLRHP